MNFALILFIAAGRYRRASGCCDALLSAAKRGARAQERQANRWWVEYAKSFFPVILVVFLLRSFLVEPFKIPSGSMMPTLLVGDFILVNKFTYGIRLPVINKKIVEINNPERGDVMVFRYPEDPVARLHQAGGRPAGRHGRVPRQAADDQRRAGADSQRRRPTLCRQRLQLRHTPWCTRRHLGDAGHTMMIEPRQPAFILSQVVGRSPTAKIASTMRGRRLRLHGAARALLHDGRQPRHQQRQPLLGLRAGQEHRRQGVFHLDELRRLWRASAPFK